MKTRVATIILNRNLGTITNNLYKKIYKYNRKYTDIFVIDSGSDVKKKSKYTTWSANWKKAKQNGLRFSRGMNYGLLKMYQENKFKNYEYFLLLTNDSEVESKPFIKELVNTMNKVKSIAILSPCSKRWGEKVLLKDKKLKFFWYIHNNAYFVRKDFIELVRKKKNFNYLNFLFDGKNFRGFGADSELIMKAYKSNMSAAITSKVWVEENENYLLKKSSLIKTDPYDRNLKLYINEGLKWIKRKYNFDSRWDLHLHVKKYYNIFFEKNKKLLKYKI